MNTSLAPLLTLAAASGIISTPAQDLSSAATSKDGLPLQVKSMDAAQLKTDTFTFVRIKFSERRSVNSRLRSGSWMTDYPDADQSFTAQFKAITGMNVTSESEIRELTDPHLSERPFCYMAEGGQLFLKEEEVESLRAYLLGGGFLMVDDFWGEEEWENLAAEFRKAFPNRQPVDLPLSHEIFNGFYEIKEKPQVPNVGTGIESQFTGITWERADAKEAHYRGLFDDGGRLMVVFCHNTDLADGWERSTEHEYYTREFSMKKAFPMGINIVVYALTH